MNYITKTEAEVIKRSWKLLLSRSPQFAEDFYAAAFVLNPSARTLFQHSMHHQATLFTQFVTRIVDKIDDWEELVDEIKLIGRHHWKSFGIPREYFNAFESAFFSSLEKVFNDQWTYDFKLAWVNFYMLLLDVMFYEKEKMYHRL